MPSLVSTHRINHHSAQPLPSLSHHATIRPHVHTVSLMPLTPTLTIRLKQYSFSLTAPYAEGSILNKADAQALNSLRAENIGKNLRKMIADKTAHLPEGGLLSQHEIDQIQLIITQYDQGYRFVERHEAKAKIGSIEAMARQLAQESAEEQARLSNRELSQDELEQGIAELIVLESIQVEARRRVAERQRIATAGIEELL